MIVDQYGQSISSDDLTTPQTEDAKLAHLHKYYAEHPSKGLTPAKLAVVLKCAEQGDVMSQCELAEDMEEKDGHLFAELQKRRLCMKSVPWKLVPPRNADKAELRDTEMLQEMLEDMTHLGDMFFDMSDAILKGFSNQEITWHQEEKLWLPKCFDFRDPSWFRLNPENRNELRLRDSSEHGEPLQPFGWVSHVHRTKSGYLSRNGLARVLAWPYIFKNFSVRDLAEFNEIYGLPLRLGRYPTGASNSEKNTLLRAVMSIGHNAGGIIPVGMDMEFQEAAKGSEKPFAYMMEFMEKTMSKAILGGTLTSQADGKSSTNALGNVHNEVREELRDSDLSQIEATTTRDIVLPMYMLNCASYKKASRSPRLEFDTTEPEDLKFLSESLPGLVDLGLKIPTRWVQDKAQIPEAKDGEDILVAASSSGTPMPTVKPPVVEADDKTTKEALSNKQSQGNAALKSIAIHKIAALKKVNDKDAAELFSEQLADKMSPVLQQFTEEVESLVLNAKSLEDLQTQLNEMDLSIDEATTVMQQALVVAELSGMADVENGD
ncbi:DUF935 domain-containing protein [Cognaticolwellia mytili]|uniref:DUF935 domain-containing protein n=1 Tax=Cognaticolwellia mytili TaxID=1888913 RepID=UPI000A174A4F|nr:DUF935 domain-containing protein [Cognaticolwellia mytili]